MSSVILTSYFSKKIHPNLSNDNHVIGRNEKGYIVNDEFNYIKSWYESVIKLDLDGRIFHDDLSEKFIKNYTTDKIKFVRTKSFQYSNNDWRFFCFRNFLEENKFDYVFHNDISDVVIVKNPETLFKDFKDVCYFACKDSIPLNKFKYIDIHKRFEWEDYVKFLLNNNIWDLINMGVVGGRYNDMLNFYTKFCEVRIKMGDPDFNSDMWILQYLLRSVFSDKEFLMGDPICSEFKKYENGREDVYFIHK